MSDKTEIEDRCGQARGDDGAPPTAATRENKKRKHSKCSEPHCIRQAQRGGRCCQHGGISIKKLCSEPDCIRQVKSGGRCIRHGGTKRRRCKEAECTRQVQSAGCCVRHGGYKMCKKWTAHAKRVAEGSVCGMEL
jgi:hypothetical protein